MRAHRHLLHLATLSSSLGLAACSVGETSNPAPILVDAPAARCPELSDTDPWKDRLGARTLAERGTLLGCAHAATFTLAEVANHAPLPPSAPAATTGYDLFVIQYVSEGRPGQAQAQTALVYLPSGDGDGVPVVAVEHSVHGIGPPCGPSQAPSVADPLAIPLAGRGYAVIAPDYAGMGVDNGMTSYLLGAAEAAATLDGLRALRQLHDPRFDAKRLGEDFFVAGHSQGGHAALFTHQLWDPSIGFRLLGSIAMAPGLGNAQEWAGFFDDPTRPVGAMETLAAASLYARMLYIGGPDPSSWLSPAAAESLPTMFHDQCLASLLFTFPAAFPRVGDLYQSSFITAAAACTVEKGCPDFEPWASSFVADEPGRFASPVPSLVLQGLADFGVSPGSVACIVDRMKARETPVQACAYPAADHTGIISSSVPDVLRWMAARREGTTVDVCPAPLTAACNTP